MGNVGFRPESDRSSDGASAPKASETSAPSVTPGGPIASNPPRTAAAPRADPLELSTITDVSQLTSLVEYNDILLSHIKEAGVSGPITPVSDVSNLRTELTGFASGLLDGIVPIAGRLRGTENLTYLGVERLFTYPRRALGKLQWAVNGCAVVAYVLERFDTVSSSRNECIKLLDSMTEMAKRLVQLNKRMPHERETLNRAVEKIVEGSIVCWCHMGRGSSFRHWYGKSRLEEVRQEIQQMYHEVNNVIVMDIQKRLMDIEKQQPNPFPQSWEKSQSPEEHQETEPVGIEYQVAELSLLLDMYSSEAV